VGMERLRWSCAEFWVHLSTEVGLSWDFWEASSRRWHGGGHRTMLCEPLSLDSVELDQE